ncbi:MAG TPA: hypothetical protein VFP89_02850 [Propionibacteriaceae bacterium]|nr:hypothetical protein [Propionibacteriaceae bacterium]
MHQPPIQINVVPGDPDGLANPHASPQQKPHQVRQILPHCVRVSVEHRQPVPTLLRCESSSAVTITALQVSDIAHRVGTQPVPAHRQPAHP